MTIPFEKEDSKPNVEFCLRMQKEANVKIKNTMYKTYLNNLYELKTSNFKMVNALYTNYSYFLGYCESAKLDEANPNAETQVTNLNCIQKINEYASFCYFQSRVFLSEIGYSEKEIKKINNDTMGHRDKIVENFSNLEKIVKKHPLKQKRK